MRGSRYVSMMIIAMVGLALGGCELVDALDGQADIDGSYALTSVNGSSLPFNAAYLDSNNYVKLKSGSASLSNGTYTQTMVSEIRVSGRSSTETERHEGTYSVSGSSLTLHSDNGRSATASYEDGGLLWDDGGNSLRFRKR